MPGTWIDRVHQHRALDKMILDLDTSMSETYGRRERPSSPGRRTSGITASHD